MSVRERQRVSCDLGWATMAMRERGRDKRVIERVMKRSGLSYDLGWRGREVETREWLRLREWGEGFKQSDLNWFLFQTVCSKQRCIEGGKRWNDTVLRLKQPNCLNRSRFTESDGRTAVRAGPCFFRMERFFTLSGQWKWTIQGFPGRTVWSGPDLTTLHKIYCENVVNVTLLLFLLNSNSYDFQIMLFNIFIRVVKIN